MTLPSSFEALMKGTRLRRLSNNDWKLAANAWGLEAAEARWVDPKTGQSWSPLGRLAWAWWGSDAVNERLSNRTLSTVLLQENNNPWHESQPGRPDVVMYWLAMQRDSSVHALLGRLSTVLRQRPSGQGRAGDGGWLDQGTSILEQDVAARGEASHGWAAGLVQGWIRSGLRTAMPSSRDWTVLSSTPTFSETLWCRWMALSLSWSPTNPMGPAEWTSARKQWSWDVRPLSPEVLDVVWGCVQQALSDRSERPTRPMTPDQAVQTMFRDHREQAPLAVLDRQPAWPEALLSDPLWAQPAHEPVFARHAPRLWAQVQALQLADQVPVATVGPSRSPLRL